MSSVAEPNRRGLGRGLEVLIGGISTTELAQIPVEDIYANPRQPRRRFDHESTAGLAESIRVQGVITPLLVRPRPAGGYELIAGERRWRAAREAGVATLPALIRDAADRDALVLGLVENVAREELTPVEEARAYALLMDEFELALGDLADRVGRSKPAISNRMRLLELSDDILAMVERGELTEGHARAVLAVPDNDGRRKLARRIVRQGLSVRAAEREARWAGARTTRRRRPAADPELAAACPSRGRAADGALRTGERQGPRDPGGRRDGARRARRSAGAGDSGGSVTVAASPAFKKDMLAEWMHDFESLEAISQDDDTRRLFLRMAALSQDGRLAPFLFELAHDDELDDELKGTLDVIARDEWFLLVVQEYIRRTRVLH